MEREQLEVDVLFVGAGPANLAGALHLATLIRDHNEAVDSGLKLGNRLTDLTLLVIEKGREIGSHTLSGALVDPKAFDELLGKLDGERPPYDAPVDDDAFYILSKNASFRSPITPPPLKNKGCFVASLGRIVKWMARLCEKNGVEVYPEFPAVQLLFNGSAVAGVRIGPRGVSREGNPKTNFDPGTDVLAKITVLGEGARGTLTRQAEQKLNLDQNQNTQIYSIGVKEIWKSTKKIPAGSVYHTIGYPLGTKEFGGGFIYTMKDDLINVGYVVGLDYEDPLLDAHRLFQQFKSHPLIREVLQDSKVVAYGAKAIPEGGYYSMPRPYADGLIIVGDSAGFLNSQRLKGIHLAVKSGMMAAETIFEALLKKDFSTEILKNYSQRFDKSWAKEELWKVRNFRQSFQRGFWPGLLHVTSQFITKGRGLQDPLPAAAGHTRMQRSIKYSGPSVGHQEVITVDSETTSDKLTDVYYSNTAHDEDQPCHLKILDFEICHNRCTQEYGNPCQHFCPAQVYEMVTHDSNPLLSINFSNCIHCKTCDIMDPYQIIVWTPPEGGGGPDYKNM